MAGIIPLPLVTVAFESGPYRISGTVTEIGVPGPYPVYLFRRSDKLLLRMVWSDAAGAYAFNNLAYKANGYYLIAFDHGANPLNAAIADLVTPELIQ